MRWLSTENPSKRGFRRAPAVLDADVVRLARYLDGLRARVGGLEDRCA